MVCGEPDQTEDVLPPPLHHRAEAAHWVGVGLEQPWQAAPQLAAAQDPPDQAALPGRAGLQPDSLQPQHLQLSSPPGQRSPPLQS